MKLISNKQAGLKQNLWSQRQICMFAACISANQARSWFKSQCISHHPKLHPAASASLPWLLSSAPSEPSAAAPQSSRTAKCRCHHQDTRTTLCAPACIAHGLQSVAAEAHNTEQAREHASCFGQAVKPCSVSANSASLLFDATL